MKKFLLLLPLLILPNLQSNAVLGIGDVSIVTDEITEITLGIIQAQQEAEKVIREAEKKIKRLKDVKTIADWAQEMVNTYELYDRLYRHIRMLDPECATQDVEIAFKSITYSMRVVSEQMNQTVKGNDGEVEKIDRLRFFVQMTEKMQQINKEIMELDYAVFQRVLDDAINEFIREQYYSFPAAGWNRYNS